MTVRGAPRLIDCCATACDDRDVISCAEVARTKGDPVAMLRWCLAHHCLRKVDMPLQAAVDAVNRHANNFLSGRVAIGEVWQGQDDTDNDFVELVNALRRLARG